MSGGVYATGPFQAMSIARAKSASVCSSYEENSTGTIGTPASSKYPRIPSQMVATLGPAATAPTRTTVFVVTLPSVIVSRTPTHRPLLACHRCYDRPAIHDRLGERAPRA